MALMSNATTSDDLSDVIFGDRNLNRRGVVTIDDLEAHGIRVVDDLNNEIFDEIGDAIMRALPHPSSCAASTSGTIYSLGAPQRPQRQP